MEPQFKMTKKKISRNRIKLVIFTVNSDFLFEIIFFIDNLMALMCKNFCVALLLTVFNIICNKML